METGRQDAELGCKWHFARQIGGREDGPNDPMQENFKKSPYASLIRESLQNSLDVQDDPDKPVRVEFKISRIQNVLYRNFFNLKEHVLGCYNYFSGNRDAETVYGDILKHFKSINNSLEKKMYYIQISDYNTKGMDYDEKSTSSPFYAFVRAAGVSSKNDATAGGSFGYGKAAYFYISPLRTVIVSTMTTDGTCCFEGVASLCTHILGDNKSEKYVSVGFYDNNDGNPQRDPDLIPLRFRRNTPGTDICIMGIDDSSREEIKKEMIEATLRNFWLAIYNNKLEVKIEGLSITSENIVELIEEYFPDKLDAARTEKGYNPRPYLEAVSSPCDKNHIHYWDEMPTIGRVDFYAVKIKGAMDKILYMRKPMMLVKAKRTQSANGFFGVFVCEDEKGNSYLRSMENPAHNEWKSTNWKLDGKTHPEGAKVNEDIDEFIKSVLDDMFGRKEQETQNIQGLEDFLYIPIENEDYDSENESLIGEPSGIMEEGNFLSTTIDKELKVSDQPQQSTLGKVIVENNTPRKQSKNRSGNNLSGKGSQTKRNSAEKGVSGKNIDSHYGDDDSGVEGEFYQEIPVKYRTFAQILPNGVVEHIVIIHSDYDIPKARIDILIGGEVTNEVVTISKCNLPCTIIGNSISGFPIHKGKNLIKVKFNDNMKYALKLDAYESK